MTREIFYGFDPGLMREELKRIRGAADKLKDAEENLIRHLYYAEKNRLFVWLGFRSLTGYCTRGLKIGRTQTQRIVTLVRQFEPKTEVRQLKQEDERETKVYPFAEIED